MSRCWIISDVPVVPISYAKTPLFVKRKLKGFTISNDLRFTTSNSDHINVHRH